MKKVLLLFATLFALGQNAFAIYDFYATAPSGQTLYYRISGGNAIVTYPGYNSDYAYYNYRKPTGNLIIPDSVTNGGITYAVTSIDGYAFIDCDNGPQLGGTRLNTVTIPNTVTSIGVGAFRDCNGLTSVSIPNSVTSIGSGAFYGCSSLSSINIPDSVTSIEGSTFYHCTSLASINIPNSVTYIGWSAFRNCNGLTSVTIPDSVFEIDQYAFAQCYHLTSVTIGSGVMYIRKSAFEDCHDITQLTCNATVPPSVPYTSTFAGVDRTIPLYVPISSISSYQAAPVWSEFTNYIGGTTENTATVTATISQITATSAYAEIVMGQQTSYFYLIYAPQSVFTQNGLTTDEAIISYVNQHYGSSDRNYSNVSGYMNDLTTNTSYQLVVVPYNSNGEVGMVCWEQFTTLNNNGIEDVGEEEYAISSQDGRLTVSGAEGNMVNVYSLDGRCIYSASAKGTTVIDIPASGTYLLKIGHHPARKVVVIR